MDCNHEKRVWFYREKLPVNRRTENVTFPPVFECRLEMSTELKFMGHKPLFRQKSGDTTGIL